jgi:23S rRNA (guanosine2251-2'-O)-methyltransferase
MSDIRLFLDNIRSVHNVGSIFRTAETAGVSNIYCIGTTPSPLDRFGRKRKDFAKVSLGTEELVRWEYVSEKDSTKCIRALKKQGFTIVALEQTRNSVDYRKVKLDEKVVIIVGNEVEGVSKKLLKLADIVAEIPLQGKKESLNVSVATGIALYRLRNF